MTLPYALRCLSRCRVSHQLSRRLATIAGAVLCVCVHRYFSMPSALAMAERTSSAQGMGRTKVKVSSGLGLQITAQDICTRAVQNYLRLAAEVERGGCRRLLGLRLGDALGSFLGAFLGSFYWLLGRSKGECGGWLSFLAGCCLGRGLPLLLYRGCC